MRTFVLFLARKSVFVPLLTLTALPASNWIVKGSVSPAAAHGAGAGSWQDCSHFLPLMPASQSFSAAGGSGSFHVDTGPGGGSCAWNAQSAAAWITVDSSPQTGDKDLTYFVAANPEAPRSGTIQILAQGIAPLYFDVHQDGLSRITICSSDVPKVVPPHSTERSTLTVDKDLYFDHTTIRLFLTGSGNHDISVQGGRRGVGLLLSLPSGDLGSTCQPAPDYRYPYPIDFGVDRVDAKGTSYTISLSTQEQSATLNCWCLEGDLPHEGLFLEPDREEVQTFTTAGLTAKMTLAGVPVANIPVNFEVRGLQGEIRLQDQQPTDSTGLARIEYSDFVPGPQSVTAKATVNGLEYTASAQLQWVQIPKCPAVSATEDTVDREATLSLSRQFRDGPLAQSDRGRQYTRLYYQLSTEAVQIMMSHPMLLLRSREILERYKPVIQSIVRRQRVTLAQGDLDEIDSFFNDYASHASRGFQEAINLIRRDLRDPQVHSEFGIRIAQGPRRELAASTTVQNLEPALLGFGPFAICGILAFGLAGRRRRNATRTAIHRVN